MSSPTPHHRSRIGDPALARRLARHVEGDVRFDALTRGLYSTDASIYQMEPIGVVLPRSLDDVSETLAIARAEGVPVLPRGAGTSQCGQTVGHAVVIDTSRYLDRVLDVDPEERTAWVEPGVVLDPLNRRLESLGLFFPVDVATASRATIGGMLGNNSGGARSIRYGIMADNVRAVDVSLPDGTVTRFGPGSPTEGADIEGRIRAIVSREAEELRTRVPEVLRHVAGYGLHRLLRPDASLAELLAGSEGTLAFFRKIQLKLAIRPRHRVLGVCHFPSLVSALDAVPALVDLRPHAVELVDSHLLGLARANPSFRGVVERYLPSGADAVLVVEFAGDEREELSRSLDALRQTVTGLGAGRGVTPAVDPQSQDSVWDMRRAALNIVMSMKGDRKPVSCVEDCGIPVEHLGAFAREVEEIFRRNGTSGTWYAHASVGCLHVRPLLNMKDLADVGAMRSIVEEVHGVVRRLGGSHSGEHGDGLLRSEFIEPMLGPRIADAFREVKRIFDPEGLMNPGKIVDAGAMDDRDLFRYGPEYRATALPTVLDWSPSGGFDRAVEMCNNNGSCRKLEPGVMCPSYRATREELDSTRGRANVLRLALTGQLGPDALRGDGVAAALALCVGCKACKRECPTGVDMARMKAEILHHRHALTPPGLRTRLLANLPRLAPTLSRFGWTTALRNRSTLAAKLGERTLGISAARSLPQWARRPFRDQELVGSAPDGEARGVVLFVDTFTRYFAPHVARSARMALAALGWRTTAPPRSGRRGRPLCCGRTFISAGLLDEARVEVRRTIQTLAPHARAGVPIVGLEPSCLLTLRDEAADLVPGEATRIVGERAALFDEFIVSHAPEAAPAPDPESPTAWIHGHCHQKAAGTDNATARLLEALTPVIARPIVSSCCGMAGSFGYEAEHASTSMAMAELSLLPAVRRAPEHDVVVANGFSCRAQILAGTGRHARHVAEVLAEELDRGSGTSAPSAWSKESSPDSVPRNAEGGDSPPPEHHR